MNLITKKNNVVKLNKVIEWLLYMIGYIIVFVIVTAMFSSVYIDKDNFILYSTIIVLIIYILNKTIKPILFTLTIPITGLTLGLFYPFINLFILKIVDWILKDHFNMSNIFISLIIAILLSIMNFIMEEIIKSIVRKVKKHEQSSN